AKVSDGHEPSYPLLPRPDPPAQPRPDSRPQWPDYSYTTPGLRAAASSAVRARRSRVRSPAAGPGTSANPGPGIGRPLTRSTTTGSATAPVSLSASRTLGPSGAKCLLPQASSASSTGRKSRPRSVSTYSYRGGLSL